MLGENMYKGMKRLIDILGSLTALIFFAPYFIVVPILIKLESPGPVLFRQERVGKDGHSFVFLKFRTMKVNYEWQKLEKALKADVVYETGRVKWESIFKMKNDPRITRVGRFLRKTSLDELPQFINVLKGDMSLVGPRPPLRYELENYGEWHKERLKCKPGITGLWQVSAGRELTFDEMVSLDIKYIQNQSLWVDIKILFKTVWVVLSGRGDYENHKV